MDLSDAAVRAAVTARLQRHHAGRPVVLGPGVLAAHTPAVARHAALGSPVLVLSTGRGAGPVPDDGTCRVVDVRLPPTCSVTEEVRLLDRVSHHLPADVVAEVEAFDPERRAVWFTSPFVTSDEPLLGRTTLGGRPASFLALEDKLRADAVWDAAGVARAPHRVVALDAGPAALDAAAGALAGPLGTVWSGDARDGPNGAGNFVRWVVDERDRAATFAFFAPRCDRVRVAPFLDGVPCSIHAMVLPDGTAAFRPVELATLRDPVRRRFVHGGLSSWWDPPEADREEMRDAVRRVGAHLAEAHGYRGAFGVDGVLTADGFRPTELNPRMSAGLTTLARVDRDLLAALQEHLLAGLDTGLTVADVETLVPLMDAGRTGRAGAVGEGVRVGGTLSTPVTVRGGRLVADPAGTATLEAADTPAGLLARLDAGDLLAVGQRLAPLAAALLAHLDETYGTAFGPLVPAPDLRTGAS
ncbi:hypothetical protein FE634_21880 [Nocardioides dongxiaopingii]|uniref:hypothetical protein n=1 Tax=Nocardioides sp. S-1144 TaxID=2582905 RepID=UPI0011658DEE|nr:hypothetical protein [Nocardioides sp. S-1144]QDH11003.1 hypothetical protein FE634_21880 [Nocardioides sp. S-1144]